MKSIQRRLSLPTLYKRLAATALTLLVASSGFALAESPPSAEEVIATIEKSQLALAEATSLGHAWSTTQPLIDSAQENLSSGNLQRAIVAAKRALLTAEQAIIQAHHERESWRNQLPDK